MQNKKFIIAPYTLGRYEAELNTYFFFNARDCNFWETDKVTGSVVAALDGIIGCEDIVAMLHKNNPNIPTPEIKDYFDKTFEFLLNEGYICECS